MIAERFPDLPSIRQEDIKMSTKITVGGKASRASTKTPSAPSQADLIALIEQQKQAIAELSSKLEAKPAGRGSNRTYAEPVTPREVALAFIEEQGAEGVRDLHHLMVQRVPNTATTEKPYGTGVLEKNKSNQDQYKMKAGLDREHYIKLGKLARQMFGDPMQYRKPQPLSDEQIDGILRPALDHLYENGKLFNWE